MFQHRAGLVPIVAMAVDDKQPYLDARCKISQKHQIPFIEELPDMLLHEEATQNVSFPGKHIEYFRKYLLRFD
jgi:hypothetical protein